MGTGVVIIIVLGILYKGGTPEAPRGLSPSWWGILGIIGWAYLLCGFIYLFAKGNLTILAISLVLLLGINIGIHADLFRIRIFFIDWLVNDASSASLMMFGVVTASMLYANMAAKNNYGRVWTVFTLAGAAIIGLGFFVRPYTHGISKIHSTPSWVLICTGIGILFFELMIWLVDVKGKQNWFKIIKPAGTSTLTCYLVPYLMVAIFYIIEFGYHHFSKYEGIVIFAVAFLVTLITGFLEKATSRRPYFILACMGILAVACTLTFLKFTGNPPEYFNLISDDFSNFFNYGAGGIIRSFEVAFLVIIITSFLEKRRLRLKI